MNISTTLANWIVNCSRCEIIFTNEYGLQEHYRQSNFHYYCSPCKRLFQSESNLKSVYQYHRKFIYTIFTDRLPLQHLNSSVHRPKDVVCPFKGCGKKFVSRSALILHLEEGACRSGVNHTTINRYVCQYDTNNIITDPSCLLTPVALPATIPSIMPAPDPGTAMDTSATYVITVIPC